MPQAVTSPIGKFSSALLKFHLSSRSPDPSHELAVSHLEAWSVVSTAEMRRKAPQGVAVPGMPQPNPHRRLGRTGAGSRCAQRRG